MPARQTTFAIVLAAAALPACVEPTPALPPAPPPCLSIVAWNDLHGQLGADDPVIDTGRVPAGGVIALADALAALRAGGDAVVALDAGDEFTGPLTSTMNEGAPVVAAHRLLGVDAAAIGNHEFDFGPAGYDRVVAKPGVGDEAGADGPRGALLARMKEASYPFLSANLHKRGGAPTGWPGHRKSVVIERGGYRVGVVGYTTEETPTTTLQRNVADLDFSTGAAASVAAEIRALRAAGAAPVVLLAHASIEGDLPSSLADDAPHRGELARLATALGADKPDVIVAGHRHAWMLGRVSGIPIVSSDQHGVGLSRIRFCGDKASPKLATIEREVVMAANPPQTDLGKQVAALVSTWEERMRPIAGARVGTLPRACEPRTPSGSAFADQVARASAENIGIAAAPPPGTPVVGLVNIGSMRAPIGPGPITFRDVFTVLPFENTVAACGTTRAGLVRFVENALRKDSSRDRFPFGISGAKVRVKRAPDRTLTLTSIEIDGEQKPVKDDTPVWLAISDFILDGGDKLLAGVPCAPAAGSDLRIREVWSRLVAREQACDGPSRNVSVE